MSLRRSVGSQPPGRECRPVPILTRGKRGARSRYLAGSPFSHRSGGSERCESAEMRISCPPVALMSLIIPPCGEGADRGHGQVSSPAQSCSALSLFEVGAHDNPGGRILRAWDTRAPCRLGERRQRLLKRLLPLPVIAPALARRHHVFASADLREVVLRWVAHHVLRLAASLEVAH